MTFTINRNGQQLGPFSRDEVLRHLSQGLLLETDLASSSQDQRWMPLSQLLTGHLPASPPSDPVALFVGKKYERYFKLRWAKLDARRSKLSWNWGACLGLYWLAYRKMYGYAFVFFGLFCVVIVGGSVGFSDQITEILTTAYTGASISLVLYGDQLYQLFVERKVKRIMARESPGQALPDLVRQGGTSFGAAIGFVAACGLVGWASAASGPRAFLSGFRSEPAHASNGGEKNNARPQREEGNRDGRAQRVDPQSSPDADAALVFGPWQPSSGVSSLGTKFCAIVSAVKDPDIGRNVAIKGYKNRDSITVDLYNASWNYPAASKVPVTVALEGPSRGSFKQNISAYADGQILDLEIPVASAGYFLLDLASKPRLRVTFPDGSDTDWTIHDAVSTETAGQLISCFDSMADGQLDARTLIALVEGLNDRCRGGSGDNAETLKACNERDAPMRQLQSLGYCYGKQGQAGYQYEWHHCGPDSIR